MDEQHARRRTAWWQQPQLQRIVAITDIVLALMLLVMSLTLQAMGYDQSGPFGLVPFWVVPSAMICLGAALLGGYGVPRNRR
jgi:sterol desaturase/sphingolipid hydroxylase (fatty acid hydroxylase superfamily)